KRIGSVAMSRLQDLEPQVSALSRAEKTELMQSVARELAVSAPGAEDQHHCSTTLIVVGEDLDPDQVTEALGMEPDQSWRRGERKSLPLPGGKVMQFDSIYEDGCWK